MPKSVDVQAPYIKWHRWHRTMHTVGPPPLLGSKIVLNLRMWNQGYGKLAEYCIFILKNPCISGPAHFKPMLLKGQPIFIKGTTLFLDSLEHLALCSLKFSSHCDTCLWKVAWWGQWNSGSLGMTKIVFLAFVKYLLVPPSLNHLCLVSPVIRSCHFAY